MKRLLAPFLAAALTLALAGAAGAVKPNEMLDDPALEDRARVISKDLRCVVCQNQSIDDSDADLAGDMRVLVRERLVAGDTNEEVKDFMVARYGNYVLLKPPMNAKTAILWAAPALALVAGLGVILTWYRARRRAFAQGAAGAGAEELSAEERKRLAELMSDGERRA